MLNFEYINELPFGCSSCYCPKTSPHAEFGNLSSSFAFLRHPFCPAPQYAFRDGTRLLNLCSPCVAFILKFLGKRGGTRSTLPGHAVRQTPAVPGDDEQRRRRTGDRDEKTGIGRDCVRGQWGSFVVDYVLLNCA